MQRIVLALSLAGAAYLSHSGSCCMGISLLLFGFRSAVTSLRWPSDRCELRLGSWNAGAL